MSDLPKATVTVTTPDGVTRIVPVTGVGHTDVEEWDEYPQADGSTIWEPRSEDSTES